MNVKMNLNIVIDDSQVKNDLTIEKMENISSSLIIEISKEVELFQKRIQAKIKKLQSNDNTSAAPEQEISADSPESQISQEEE